MNTKPKTITGGVYLILDPRIERQELLEKLKQALDGGVSVLQIWNCWPPFFTLTDKEQLIREISRVAAGYSTPVLINEEWELLRTTDLNGVHFDRIPDQFTRIKSELNRDFITGITCSNDLNIIRWADENNLDYISFCSMFPSSSVDNCEIVRPETVRKAREITRLPLFVSGGITTENLPELAALYVNGVAVISGILNSGSPKQSVFDYKQALNKLKTG